MKLPPIECDSVPAAINVLVEARRNVPSYDNPEPPPRSVTFPAGAKVFDVQINNELSEKTVSVFAVEEALKGISLSLSMS
ncbi:MAG: hypothetical protein UV60_C0009G0002 [Parcubacteria group bacterium GW2011_GWA2_43_11]|nr:MAG: hypothetical protein UV60_C0009G0002 [Parcubacteria group bacterium GW2011_GWA2_43_11]